MADEIKFHSNRAMAELRSCDPRRPPVAARAHLALSDLHLERMRGLCETQASTAEFAVVG